MIIDTNKPSLSFVRGLVLGLLVAPLALTMSAASAADPNPYAMADNAWISISGTVESVRRDNFTLDYGDGMVIVEMDDGDRDADAYKLIKGDKVTVSGRIDDDLFEATKIEAGSVFVENLGTTFFASSIDDEWSERLLATVTVPVIVSSTVVQGTVTDVGSHEFTVEAGTATLKIDTNSLAYDPLDNKGYQKIAKGDRVKITGVFNRDLIEGRELVATSIVTLNDADGEQETENRTSMNVDDSNN